MLLAKHDDYPAIDIPAPTGTPYFSITWSRVGAYLVLTLPTNGCFEP